MVRKMYVVLQKLHIFPFYTEKAKEMDQKQRETKEIIKFIRNRFRFFIPIILSIGLILNSIFPCSIFKTVFFYAEMFHRTKLFFGLFRNISSLQTRNLNIKKTVICIIKFIGNSFNNHTCCPGSHLCILSISMRFAQLCSFFCRKW